MRILIIIFLLTFALLFGQFKSFSNYANFKTEYAYQSESLVLFARMEVQPDETRKQLIDGLIADLKDEGLWDKILLFYTFASHTKQAGLLNWRSTNYDAILGVDDIFFVSDQGMAGNSEDMYIDTGFNPATDGGGLLSANSICVGIYSRTSTNSNIKYLFGIVDDTLGLALNWRVDDTERYYANGEYVDYQTALPSVGFSILNRTDSEYFTRQKQDGIYSIISSPSIALPDGDMFILAQNDFSFGGEYFSDSEIGFFFLSSGLTTDQISILTNLVETKYLHPIGASVIDPHPPVVVGYGTAWDAEVDYIAQEATITDDNDRLLIVAIATNANGSPIADSVKWGSSLLTLKKRITQDNNAQAELFYFVNPDIGTDSIRVYYSEELNLESHVGWVYLNNANQSSPFGDIDTLIQASGSGSPISLTVLSDTTELIFGFMCSENEGIITEGVGQIVLWEEYPDLGGDNIAAGGSYKHGEADSTTMEYGLFDDEHRAFMVIAIKAKSSE